MDLKTAERIARGENLIAEAERLIAKHRADKKAARARRRSRSPRASGADKDQRRKERMARTANVRVEVFKRDEGRCVVCGAEATEMHHLVYGSGWRAIMESGKTCAAVCAWHHREAHAGGWATMEALQRWARERGYSVAADALVRRMDKIAAVRRTP